jgi:dipeptidyl aminopeptidase/acylaminoacyl peptidase
MAKRISLVVFVASLVFGVFIAKRSGSLGWFSRSDNEVRREFEPSSGEQDLHPLSIEYLKEIKTPGSDLTIGEDLGPGRGYNQYIASYVSEGNKVFGLLTVPIGEPPEGGWPAIIFNHGYIPPSQYKTTERYVAYVDFFARRGYVVFKSDYRGHGNSEGVAMGGYGSNSYTIDVLNGLESVKKLSYVNPQRIGMWGHSMGGYITLRAMVSGRNIKAGVIWAGVVGSYEDLLNNWRRRTSVTPSVMPQARRWRQELVEKYGTPETNPQFWNSISANSFLSDLSGPIQLHHGTLDTSVPFEFSEKLADQIMNEDKAVEIYAYDGDDHNLSRSFSLAMERSVNFFDKYLK